MKKTKRIMLYITDEQYDKLKAAADKESRSLNNFITMLIEKYLEEAPKK
jgi:uncharacterized protein (DUF1778 family)